MRVMKLSLVGSVVFWGFFLLTALVRAGGPIAFNEGPVGNFKGGEPLRWTAFDNQDQLISRAVFFVETGPLGAILNQDPARAACDPARARDAARAACEAFKTWEKVSTADLRIAELTDVDPKFKKDITGADFAPVQCDALSPPPPLPPSVFRSSNFECELIRACVAIPNRRNCPSPVIFDSNGEIIDLFFGIPNSVIAFSGPLLVRTPAASPLPPAPPPFSIIQARTVINGRFFDNDPDNSFKLDDPTGTMFLPGVLTHEFGHFLGLAHSVVNGNPAAFNPAIQSVDSSTRGQLGSPSSVDPLVSVPLEGVETMFPRFLSDLDQRNFSDSLEKDDEVALSASYPCTTQARVAGRCTQEFSASTGTISGRVFIQNASKPAQGVVVVARCLDCPVDNPNKPESALTNAVSQFTGGTFAPRRCNTNFLIDTNGDGNPDTSILRGLFGGCSTTGLAGRTECFDQAVNFFKNNPGFFSQFSPPFSAASACGFFSFGLSDPRLIPSDQENLYVLQGLPPGEYVVQALQAIIGGFSSPVRSSFGNPVIRILSDDNVSFTRRFPNPQTGEFYNGPSTGCNPSNLTTCLDANGNSSGEAGSSSDNPFAFTRIKVTAGGPPIENVNIFLNAGNTEDAFFADPGFDYCGLGDVNTDGKVDEGDILAVVTAKAAFDKDGTLNKRADLNADGAITFLDVDIITDLVTNPYPSGNFPGFVSSAVTRLIAPFEAICTAARGRCAIQAPEQTIQADGKPNSAVCTVAANLKCQVIGCP